jgi:hypothetical protein
VAADHADAGELRALSEHTAERLEVASLDRRGQCDGDRIAVG